MIEKLDLASFPIYKMRKSFYLAVFFVMRLGAVCFLRGRGMFKIHLGKRGGLGRFLQLGGPRCV